MNILLVGRGWIGNKVYDELIDREHNVEFCSHTNVFEKLTRPYSSTKYDWVVNCAGITGTPNIDACEFDKENTFNGNTLFPINLSNVVDTYGARLAHFSSGCIYDGTISSPDSPPNFFENTYSVSKGLADTFLRNRAHVYRIHLPFTGLDEPKNLLTKIIKYSKTGKLFDSGPNSLSDLHEAIYVACELMEDNVPNGPYNLVNSGSITVNQLVDMMGISANWFTGEISSTIKRSNCVIPAYYKMRSVEDALQDAINKLLDK